MRDYEVYVQRKDLSGNCTCEIVCQVDEFPIACEKYCLQVISERGRSERYDQLEIDFVKVGLYDRYFERIIMKEIIKKS